MLKEKDYDEFVNECVKKGREEHQAGMGFTLEQSREHIQKVIEQKSQEFSEFHREVVYG